VNDNYCDCSDGSDEPGTPACANGRFYCRNEGYIGNEIFSTQVWDGICDCCDGSDEKGTKTVCKNYCLEKAAVARQVIEKEIQMHTEGLKRKRELIDQARRELLEKRQELVELKQSNLLLTEKKERAEDIKKQMEEEEAIKRKELEEVKAQQSNETKPAEEVTENNDTSFNETEENWDEEELKPFSEGTQKAKTDLAEAENALRDNENQINDIEELLSIDFGQEKEFYYMNGKSYTVDTTEYTYELVPFDKVLQKPKVGSSTSLGEWDNTKQTTSWTDLHKEMIYSNGAKCYGGPDRSTKITVLCDMDTRIAEPKEPNKCEYTLNLYTPVACNDQDLQVLQLNLGQPTQYHDEL